MNVPPNPVLLLVLGISIVALSGINTNSLVFGQSMIGNSGSVSPGNLMMSNLSSFGNFGESRSSSPLSNMPFDLSGLENLFAGKSIIGTLGISMVNNVSVSGIQLLNENAISVTLKHGPENISPPVTVIAYKISLNSTDLGSLMKLMGNNTSQSLQNGSFDTYSGSSPGSLPNPEDKQMNPFAILEKIQIGSSSVTSRGWMSPYNVTMGMIRNTNYPSNFDLILIMAIPYTGSDNTQPIAN